MPTRRRVARSLAAGLAASRLAPAIAATPGFEAFATFSSATAGGQLVSPFGIPFPFGRIAATQRARIAARYPAGPGGSLLPLQLEQFKLRRDGTLVHCTGHLRLPAGYVARAPVEIGLAPEGQAPRPAPPDWDALWREPADFTVTLSTWEPRVHWLALDRAPVEGDAIEVTFVDSRGTLRYERRFAPRHSWKEAHEHGRAALDHLAKLVTQDPAGRYCCYEPRFLPRREGRAGEANDDHFRPKYGNSLVVNDIGIPFGRMHEAAEHGPRRSMGRVHGSDRWNEQSGRFGMYVWPRWSPGDPEPWEMRVAITRGPGSQLSFLADRNGRRATEGVLEPVNDPVPRRAWEARFADGADTPDSPWFDGPLLRQVERRAAFVSRGEAHPHLEAWFRVSRDASGRIVDRQVSVENPRMFAAAREYRYDADVRVDGASRTTRPAERWRNLLHAPWEGWRWAEAKPFGMCSAADFMRARLVFAWTRFPSEDRTAEMAAKLRGADIDFERNETAALRWKGGAKVEDWTGLRRPVRDALNEPLYAGAWCFTGEGGARTELGVFSGWEWLFWTGDTLASWPSLEALADNVMGAYGFQVRDELAQGDAALCAPDLYMRWDVAPHHMTTTRLGNPFGRPQQPDARFHPVSQGYALKRPFHPVNSHLPSSGIYSAYLVRPEKCFFDRQEQYAWFCLLKTQSQNTITAPRRGGAPGDAGHVVGYQVANGERPDAWPMREIARTAVLRFEGPRRRAYWRRVAQDQAAHFNLLCERTIWGAFHVRNLFNPGSDDWRDVPAILPGGQLRGPSPGHVLSMSRLDAFKSAYANMCAMHAMDIDAADFSPGIQACTWQLLALEQAPPGKWWRLLGAPGFATVLCSDLVPGPSPWGGEDMVSASGRWPVWPASDMRELHAWLERMAADTRAARILRLPSGLADFAADLRQVGYSFVKQHQAGLHMLLRYHRDAGVREAARRWIDRIDAAWPGSARIAVSGDPSRPMAKLYQQLDLTPEDRIA
ncbi:MAG: hypothetical protein ACO3CS_16760 [Alphaproteobacteria bacterium]